MMVSITTFDGKKAIIKIADPSDGRTPAVLVTKTQYSIVPRRVFSLIPLSLITGTVPQYQETGAMEVPDMEIPY